MMLRQRSCMRRRWTRHTNRHLEGVSLLVRLYLDFIAWWEKRVESDDKLGMPLEQMAYSGNNTRRIYALRLEFFHDIQEIIVHLLEKKDTKNISALK